MGGTKRGRGKGCGTVKLNTLVLAAGGAGLVALLIIVRFINQAPPDYGYADLNRDLAAMESAATSASADREVAEIVVKGLLRDPSSATFLHHPDSAGCGWVNARNGYGGMAGDQAFIVTHGPAMFDDGSLRFAEKWSEVCGDATTAPRG